jgi:hypothetical protein
MPRGAASVLLATGLISVTTAATRVSQVPLRALAATPQSLAEGRIWLLATSALIADRPAFASIAGFLAVGVVAVWLCGSRVVWVAAATGHIFSAAIVYVGIGLVRLAEPGAFESAAKGALTVLDWEHLFALGFGAAALRYAEVFQFGLRPGLKPNTVSSRT